MQDGGVVQETMQFVWGEQIGLFQIDSGTATPPAQYRSYLPILVIVSVLERVERSNNKKLIVKEA